MDIFLDTANLMDIERWLNLGVLDGVTTNPSIMLKEGGYDMERRARDIAALVFPRPVSVEVTTNILPEMLTQARTFAQWADNIVVKIPVINEDGEPCLGIVKTLVDENIKVNMTACLSLGQVILGAKAGATYISIFAGRVSDEGHDASVLIRQAVGWLAAGGYASKIIVGSVREAINLQDAALAGAHVLTSPPQFLEKWVDHHYTRATVKGFNEDARAALDKMDQALIAAS